MADLSREFARLFLGMFCIGCCGLPIVPAAAQATSSFQSSCSHISIAGNALVANCRRVDGSVNRTSIVLEGIENIDGQLQTTGPGSPATFQDSCRRILMYGSTLTARCRRVDGSYQRASIELPGISNIDGNLQYQH